MNFFKSMNDALNYIEHNIDKTIDADKVAEIALCSKYHFLRMFTALTDVSLGEYVRHRRLSLAAMELSTTSIKVVDVALKYGYETPEAFTKAFKRLHGVTPSQARKNQSILKAIPPLSFQITIQGAEPMDYQIIKKNAFKVTGLSRMVTTKDSLNYQIIPDFWTEVCQNGVVSKLHDVSDTKLGVCYDMKKDQEEFSYMIGCECDHIDELTEAITLDVASHTWAVFKSVGPMPHAIQNVWKRIFSEWFPATKYEHADGPELEVYLPGDPDAPDYVCEVWIPIVEK